MKETEGTEVRDGRVVLYVPLAERAVRALELTIHVYSVSCSTCSDFECVVVDEC
jgi:hypothetical protein